MANLRRVPYTKPIPPGAELFTRKGKRYARYKDAKGKAHEAPLTEDGSRMRFLSKKYYGEFKDADGRDCCVPLSTDKTAAEQMLAALVRKHEFKKANISDPYEEPRKKPLTDHLEDFRKALLADNNTEKHARQTVSRGKKVVAGCKFVFSGDVQASRVAEWLADERKAGRLSITTSNYYLRDLKSFFVWMAKDKRCAENPLAHLEPLNRDVESHRQRRALEPDEYRRLLAAAQT